MAVVAGNGPFPAMNGYAKRTAGLWPKDQYDPYGGVVRGGMDSLVIRGRLFSIMAGLLVGVPPLTPVAPLMKPGLGDVRLASAVSLAHVVATKTVVYFVVVRRLDPSRRFSS
jgi:hypothetical protein